MSNPQETTGAPFYDEHHERSAKQWRKILKGQIKSTKKKSTQRQRRAVTINNNNNNINISTTNIPSAPSTKQATLSGEILDHKDSEAFGSYFTASKPSNITRVMFQNIGPQPQHKLHNKTRWNVTAFDEGNYDVVLFAEHCLNISKLALEDSWQERMNIGSLGRYSILASNRTENSKSTWHQVGGTGITMNNAFRSMKDTHGVDATGLGRWTWTRIRGRQGESVRFIAAYRPVKNPKEIGSTWSQQVRYFRKERQLAHPDPQQEWLQDLSTLLTELQIL